MTFSTFQKYMMLILALASLSACAPATQVSSSTANGVVTGNGGTSTSMKYCKSAAAIYDVSTAGGTFEQRVKSLISATVDPQLFGTIDGSGSGSNCVSIEARLNYDSSGSVNLNQSTLKITIYDSLVGTLNSSGSAINPYEINFSAATSGSVNISSKTFTLQFKDQYGAINLSGTLASPTTTGTISYQNSASYNNGAASSGTLGAFSLSTSSFAY